MRIEELKELSKRQLKKKFPKCSNISGLFSAIANYEKLSNNSKNNLQIAEDLGWKRSTVNQYRSFLIQIGVLEPRVGTPMGLFNIKRLGSQESSGIKYHFVRFNEIESEAIGIDPDKKPFYIVEPRKNEVLIRFFYTRKNASEYKKKL